MNIRVEGTKYDNDKIRMELLPPEFLYATATVLTFGANKYDDRNWELGMKWSRVFGALMRHMWCWFAGNGPTAKSFAFGSLDDDTKLSHLWHASCCMAFLVSYEERSVGTDDRPGKAKISLDDKIKVSDSDDFGEALGDPTDWENTSQFPKHMRRDPTNKADLSI